MPWLYHCFLFRSKYGEQELSCRKVLQGVQLTLIITFKIVSVESSLPTSDVSSGEVISNRRVIGG